MYKKLTSIVVMFLVMLYAASALDVEVLSTDPAPLKAGEFADITVEIAADASEEDYTDLDVTLRETSFIRLVSAKDLRFATFRSGRSATDTFRIFIEEDLPEGFIDLQFDVTSNQGSLEYKERVFVEDADSQPELLVGSVRSTPQELLPDTDDNELVITIQNLGDKDAELVKATLQVPEGISPSYSYSLEDSVSSINSGAEAELTFTIDIDETIEESVQAQLELRYRTELTDTYETKTTLIPVDIQLIDAPLLSIVGVEQLDSFVGGTTENKVLVTVRNDGKEDAEEVRVRVVPDISYPFIFEATTQYVSSKIEPGEEATVAFKAEVTSSAEDKTYDITTKLESLVGEARYTREDVLRIETSVGEAVSGGSIGALVLVVVIVLAVLIGWQQYRARQPTRRKKR